MKRNDRTALSAFLRILPWIVTLLAAAAVGYYILFPGWGYFHSDCTDTILWAQASYDAGALFNPDFEYACLLPFGGQLLMLPFIGLFGVSTTTHAIGMLLFLLLFTASLLLLGRALKWTRAGRRRWRRSPCFCSRRATSCGRSSGGTSFITAWGSCS